MRLRSVSALSALAATALLLAGCATATPTATPTTSAAAPTQAAPVDLCSAQAASGPASDAVTAEGAVGEKPTVAVPAGTEVTAFEVTTMVEGTGEAIADGEAVNYAITAIDPATGAEIAALGYEPGQQLPVPVTAAQTFGQIFGCSPIGSRFAVAFPGDADGAAQMYVIDTLSKGPTAAWGEPQTPQDGLPTVALADDGTPTITLPGGDAPTETTVEVLKQGDGAEVAEGAQVLIQYQGVRWSNGEIFDQTWGAAPYSAGSTAGFVPGFQQALVGHTVGSQVLVVIPPKDGYGEGEINDQDMVGETMVFVVDILATAAAPTAPAQ